MATYFGSTPVFTGHKDDYTHNFKDRITNQEGQVNSKNEAYDKTLQQAEQAKGQYGDKITNQQDYQSMWEQAQKNNQVAEAQKQYQDSLSAINATGSAMATLPSSVNANSNVSMTQAQRNAALGNQMMKYQNTANFWNRQNAQDQARYQDMLKQANIEAQGNYQNQRDVIADMFNNYRQQMADASARYGEYAQDKNFLQNIYGQMYDDEYHHMDDAYRAWLANLQAETDRYNTDAQERMNNAKLKLEADLAARENDLQRYLGDLNAGVSRKPTFEDFLMSPTSREIGDFAEGMTEDDKIDYSNVLLRNYIAAKEANDSHALRNIMEGTSYQDYQNWLKGGGE